MSSGLGSACSACSSEALHHDDANSTEDNLTMSAPHADSISFVAFGDWGWDCYDSLQGLAERIQTASTCGGQQCRSLQCAIALGDNFYPDGISSTRDQRIGCWRTLFTQDPSSVPWLVVPGNHDYYSTNGIQAQLDLSSDAKRNPDGKWCMGSVVPMPDDSDSAFCTCGTRSVSPSTTSSAESPRSTTTAIPPPPPPPLPRPTSRGTRRPPPLQLQTATPKKCPAHCPERVPWAVHSFPISTTTVVTQQQQQHALPTVDLFLIDTCGAQFSVRNRHPTVLTVMWPRQKEWLRQALSQSTAQWKIVAGHHPLFTHGVGHQNEARCLRGNEYTTMADPFTVLPGMGLLDVLHEGRADVYLSGHEHAFQAAEDICPKSGHSLRCIGAGNSMETFYWRGKYASPTSAECEGGEDLEADAQCLELFEQRRKSTPTTAPPTPSTLHHLRNGEAPDVDPHRSLFSRRSHVDMEGPEGVIGVLRLDISANRCTIRHIHHQNAPINEVSLKK
ncbi:acid phosphatase, putative [Bodo saltans]|uniref:Acid phosphatase, putative n=1 Tax=Bodo saltans TaxID=75058 RepID=A0A0S4INV5_BODSA|nr:acid phosphatase, putative [Bodo saltans]|eukprot:CUE87434.1 acid phosphatase, putative [Bodo saltans]